MKITVYRKIWLCNTILIAGFFATILIGFLVGNQRELRLGGIADTLFPAAMQSHSAVTIFRKQTKLYHDAVLLGENELLQEADSVAQECRRILSNIALLKGLPLLSRKSLNEALSKHQELSQKANEVYARMCQGNFETKGDVDPYVQAASLNTQTDLLDTQLLNIEKNISKELNYEIRDLREISHTQRFISLAVFCLVITLSIGLMSFILKRYVMSPLTKAIEAIRIVSNGDLTHWIETTNQDEIGELGGHINVMVERMNQVLGKIQLTAKDIHNNSKEVSERSKSQFDGVDGQAAAIAEMSAATSEMANTSEHIGNTINSITQISEHVSKGILEVKQATDQTNHLLTLLNSKSQQIGDIVKVIDDVTDQTNLLAVNASIEAARAGNAGKGFAVVADQITKLADSTSHSAKSIASLIDTIQGDMSDAISAMEKGINSIDSEQLLAQDAVGKSHEIAAAVSQQIASTHVIADAMRSIDETMKKISNDAQKSSSTSANLTDLARELEHGVADFVIRT